jgi:flagellar FliL protein
MSSASATADAPQKGNKKLIIIIASAVLLVGIGGGAIAYVLKQKATAAAAAAADEEEGGDAADATEDAAPAKAESRKSKQVPTFVPLEPFVVNLADKETERFAQVGVTLEVDDAKFADELKAYMPAIRNGILMVLAHKTSAELLTQEGKLALQKEILRESVLPLGIEVEDEGDASSQGKRKKKRKSNVHNPVTKVHFSNFIVQ